MVATGAFFSCCAHVLEQQLTNFSETGALVNNFVDAQFLQAVWPQELDNVRLLIITVVNGGIMTHDWNLFTPKASVQAAIDAGEEWAGRDIILKLENGHFTILRAQSENQHPIQELLNMIGESKGTEAPGERQLLHLESIFGGEPDPTRPRSLLQLYDTVFECAESSATQSAEPPVSAGTHSCSAAHSDEVSSASNSEATGSGSAPAAVEQSSASAASGVEAAQS